MEDACVPLLVVLLVVHPIKMLNPLVTAFFLKWQPDRTTDPTNPAERPHLAPPEPFLPAASESAMATASGCECCRSVPVLNVLQHLPTAVTVYYPMQ